MLYGSRPGTVEILPAATDAVKSRPTSIAQFTSVTYAHSDQGNLERWLKSGGDHNVNDGHPSIRDYMMLGAKQEMGAAASVPTEAGEESPEETAACVLLAVGSRVRGACRRLWTRLKDMFRLCAALRAR